MDKELIAQQEAANDGQTINLYFDDMVGMYVAYGLSAYYADMLTNPILSFSSALAEPVALLGRGNILYLRQSLTKVEHTQKTYYQFQMRTKIGDAGYNRWKEKHIKME